MGLHPAVFTRLCNLALVRMKKPPLPDRFQTGPYLRAIGNTVLRTLFLGFALFFAAKGLGPIAWKHYPLAVASAGFAGPDALVPRWSIGDCSGRAESHRPSREWCSCPSERTTSFV